MLIQFLFVLVAIIVGARLGGIGLGVMGGISTAVDTYAPDHSGDEQFHQDVYNYFQKVGNIDNITQDSFLVDVTNIIIQETMAFVMMVTAILMAIVLVLTFRLEDIKIKQ